MSKRAAKAAAWVLAVPLLCVAVIVGGATPLYLLLPDARGKSDTTAPALEASSSPTAGNEKGDPPQHDVTENAIPAPASPVGSAGDADPQTTGAVAESDDAAVQPETIVASVIPTPRPAPVEAGTAASDGGQRIASVETAPAPARTSSTAAVDRRETNAGRIVIRRTVNLRDAPWGRRLGVIKAGTRVAVGRCDGWCEIEVDGTHGWVHPSFIAGARTTVAASRSPTRRGEQRRMEASRGAEWLQRERERVGRRSADPDWLDEEPPPIAYGRRPPVDRYDDFGPLDPYY